MLEDSLMRGSITASGGRPRGHGAAERGRSASPHHAPEWRSPSWRVRDAR